MIKGVATELYSSAEWCWTVGLDEHWQLWQCKPQRELRQKYSLLPEVLADAALQRCFVPLGLHQTLCHCGIIAALWYRWMQRNHWQSGHRMAAIALQQLASLSPSCKIRCLQLTKPPLVMQHRKGGLQAWACLRASKPPEGPVIPFAYLSCVHAPVICPLLGLLSTYDDNV